jgi:transposase-like protein
MIVVPNPGRAEQTLQAGKMRCPRCSGRLRPHGHGRARTVRGLGQAAVPARPRRARCVRCGATQILLPGELTVRRADSTEVIGTALAAKAAGHGFRTIAAELGRPASTVRRWLRRARGPHARWLYLRAVERCAEIDRSLLERPAPHKTSLGDALNLLAGAALRYRQRLSLPDPHWALIALFVHGRLIAPPPIR